MSTTDEQLQPLLGALLAVCNRFTARMETEGFKLLTDKARARLRLVMPEPYVPFLPSASPKVLVLAESQNLSATNRRYVDWLLGLDQNGKYRRLLDGKPGTDGEQGIQPWDDGTLKLAIQAVLKVEPIAIAVSNAVPWSWVDGNANARPFTKKTLGMAADFWAAVFKHWMPDRIVAAGAVARDVMRTALDVELRGRLLEWALPSPRLDPSGRMFDPSDLMTRFMIDSKVQAAILAPGNRLRHRQAFYVCHAVSTTGLPGNRAT